ncbi:universal stress protein [Microvirga massiliensis]|uniref:universal stress protein n=1 Tax=Microvirga massiliensis TaxID=1033741 RepID=UPI00062B9D56|nr:universal stress protein [Microvirga massiliensis]
MSGRRRSYESGHRPKFLVVVDETPECSRAIHFAARRAARTGSSMVILAVVDPPHNFEWIGVGEAMLAEGQEEAQKRLETAAKEARSAAGVEPEQVVLVREKPAAITEIIENDADISFLVLAAGTGKEGPGPLVSTIAGKTASTFPIPIVIVPGGLSDEEIDALAG